MSVLPVGTRVTRRCGLTLNGNPIDHYVGRRGTVVEHEMPTDPSGLPPDTSSIFYYRPRYGTGYHIVLFDGDTELTKWAIGHPGIVPLDAVTLLGEKADPA